MRFSEQTEPDAYVDRMTAEDDAFGYISDTEYESDDADSIENGAEGRVTGDTNAHDAIHEPKCIAECSILLKLNE